MQLVLKNNRVVAHGENFISLSGVVINTETGAKYDNATIAECENCPSDINEVGYEYHSGVFVPCAPYGRGDNKGCFMEVCTSCATPRNSGIPVIGGLSRENLNIFPKIWENASIGSAFNAQAITVSTEYAAYIIKFAQNQTVSVDYDGMWIWIPNNPNESRTATRGNGSQNPYQRTVTNNYGSLYFDSCSFLNGSYYSQNNGVLVPLVIYGVKL